MLHFNLLLNRVGCCILISDEFFPRLMSGYNEEDIILPTAYFYAALAAGIAAVVVFLVLRVKCGGLKGLYSKAIASFFFLLTALCAAAANPGHGVYAVLIVFGLVLGLSGDIWLDLKWIYEKDMEKFLNAGFIAFMIGHVFYIGAIYKFAGNWSVLTAVLPIIISVVVAIGNVIVSEKLLKLKFGKFRTIVGVYTFFLFMTFAVSAVAMLNNSFAKQWILMSAGGLLFAFSDAVLSTMYFKEGGNTKANIIINHVSYYAAQFVIASSVLFIK